MGSFNTVCFASKQVIKPNDKVCIFPICCYTGENKVTLTKDGNQFKTTNTLRGVSCPTSSWTYAGPMLEGTYNDYGEFLLTNTVENLVHVKKLFDILSENSYIAETRPYGSISHFDMSEFYSRSEEYTYDELAYVWRVLQDAINNDSLYIEHPDCDAPYLVKLAVMTLHTKNTLCDITAVYWKEWHGVSRYERMVYSFEGIVKSVHAIGFDNEKFKAWVTRDIECSIMELESCSLKGLYAIVLKSWELLPDEVPLFVAGFKLYNTTLIEHGMVTDALVTLGVKLEPKSYHDQDYQNSSGTKYLEMVSKVNKLIKRDLENESK